MAPDRPLLDRSENGAGGVSRNACFGPQAGLTGASAVGALRYGCLFAAFPGWKVEEIRLALTEEPLSGKAWRALERVALAMGAQEGTGPENDPLMRSMHRRARASGHAQGRTEAVVAALHARGIEVSHAFTTGSELLAEHPVEALMAAALACTDEADFRRRIDKKAG